MPTAEGRSAEETVKSDFERGSAAVLVFQRPPGVGERRRPEVYERLPSEVGDRWRAEHAETQAMHRARRARNRQRARAALVELERARAREREKPLSLAAIITGLTFATAVGVALAFIV